MYLKKHIASTIRSIEPFQRSSNPTATLRVWLRGRRVCAIERRGYEERRAEGGWTVSSRVVTAYCCEVKINDCKIKQTWKRTSARFALPSQPIVSLFVGAITHPSTRLMCREIWTHHLTLCTANVLPLCAPDMYIVAIPCHIASTRCIVSHANYFVDLFIVIYIVIRLDLDGF